MTVIINGTTGIDKVQPSASSGQVLELNGITFPATQVASANANTLDDYEEGTWSPTLNGSISLGTGRYIKIGQLVQVEISSYNTNISSLAVGTAWNIQGLPFSMTAYNYIMPCIYQGGAVMGIYDATGTTVSIGQGGNNVDIQTVSRSTFGSASFFSFRFSLVYRATA